MDLKISGDLHDFYSLSILPNGDLVVTEGKGYKFRFLETNWYLAQLGPFYWVCVEETIGLWGSFGATADEAASSLAESLGKDREASLKELKEKREYFKKAIMPLLLIGELEPIAGEPQRTGKERMEALECIGSA